MVNIKGNPQKFARRVVELLGGHDAAVKKLREEFDELEGLWNQNSAMLGRLLRGHLFVEYYLTRYLQFKNPALRDPDKARLSFAQKVALAEQPGAPEYYLFVGIRRLNKIRNRIAHTLRAEIKDGDRDVFLGIKEFAAIRNALVAPATPGMDGIDVVEDFARYAGMVLAHFGSSQAALWEQATRESLEPDEEPRET
jgi:hypothetical protein